MQMQIRMQNAHANDNDNPTADALSANLARPASVVSGASRQPLALGSQAQCRIPGQSYHGS